MVVQLVPANTGSRNAPKHSLLRPASSGLGTSVSPKLRCSNISKSTRLGWSGWFQWATSFDHLVGAGSERCRHSEPKHH
jgi:hypothetical protein